MFVPQSRRTFIQTVVSGTLTMGAGSIAGGCTPSGNSEADRPTRRNIASLAPNDPVIETYRAAVAAMKALPTTDGRNWTRQAKIHETHCPHGNWFFLPWHRAYLHYFEEICRELTGNEDFALPYWNWTTSPRIPGIFWGGETNPLFNANRTATATSMVSGASTGPAALDEILSQPNFLVFGSMPSTEQKTETGSGELEATPHNYVHGFVGGTMGEMTSPLDPIFWTHHNMIECCWVNWNLHRGHANPSDAAWRDFVFRQNFVDRHGKPVDVRVSDTLLLPLTSYQFEDCFPTAKADAAGMRENAQKGAPARLEYTERVPLRRSVEVSVGQPVALELPVRPDRLADALKTQPDHRILLTIGDVTAPADAEFAVHVFLDRHAGQVAASEHSPTFAGSISFFAGATGHGGHGASRPEFLLDVTGTVRRIFEDGATATNPEHLVVHLVPTALEGRAAQDTRFRLEFVEVAVVRAPRD